MFKLHIMVSQKISQIGLVVLIFLFSQVLQAQTVTYNASTADIVNPDRGFYYPIEANSSSFVPLNLNNLISIRENAFTPWQGNYTVRTSLVFRHYVLSSFAGTDNLSSTFLNQMQADFDIARQAGVRLILRYSYTTSPNTSCGQAACSPYGDAPKSRVLAHIAQLQPYLQANEDVIAVVQSGFIGVWGEQYYTDYFGDASAAGKLFNADWQNRIDVLDALLDATPTNRMVQARYSQMKQKYVGGPTAPVTSAPMAAGEAHTGSKRSRIAFHNDCFLAAADDFGTHWDYGSDATSASDQTGILKPYAAAEGMFTAIGGETCSDGYSPQNDCSGIAVSEMASLHYSFLNSDYNNAVNNDWQTGGCMDEIKQKLGYRFVMLNGTYPGSASAGGNFSFTLNLENVGFAAPYNERELALVLRNTTTGNEYKASLSGSNTDTRFWYTGNVTLNATASLPSSLPNGDYQVLLHILDPSNNGAIANRPEYSIQLANTNTWEASTGFNKLNHTVSIGGVVEPADCIVIDGDFSDWPAISNISTNGINGLNSLKAADDNDNFYIYAAADLNTNYQLFLDTDNEAIGTNEYTNTQWNQTGFNFMIENGNLYAYTGTGADWAWSLVAAVNAIKNASGLELEVSKSLLGNSLSTINVGLAALDGTWTGVGHIPNATSGAAYTETGLDCTDESAPIVLDICAFLEATYDSNSGLMSNELENLGILPATQPYSGVPWNYAGTENRSVSNIADWVLVSFRTSTAKEDEIAKTAGLLQTDGCIYFPDDNVLPSGFNTPVYIVVEHRNHIGIMSPQPLSISNNTLSYDFRTADSYAAGGGLGQKQVASGAWCMLTGDMNPTDAGSYDINGSDKAIWQAENGLFNDYFSADLNQDGDVNGGDKALWNSNNGAFSSVPK